MTGRRLLFAACLAALAPASASAQSRYSPAPEALRSWCDGQCYATLMIGRRFETSMRGLVSFNSETEPWNWEWGNGGLVSAQFGRRLYSFRDWASLEAEAGVGQRFGDLHETEGWVALYARWQLFPWNNYVKTSVAVSTGLNYASGLPQYEILRSDTARGSRLMHYFAPEVTFALPDRPDWEAVVRLHHRSGMASYLGGVSDALFNGTGGGAQHWMIGVRHRF